MALESGDGNISGVATLEDRTLGEAQEQLLASMREEPAAKTGKRRLRKFKPTEKLYAIRRVQDGESKASVARDIGVPESTLRGWCKKSEQKIRNSTVSTVSRSSLSPDSVEAHSPASSLGATPLSLSEDEGTGAAGHTSKKMKLAPELEAAGCSTKHNSNHNHHDSNETTNGAEYIALLQNLMAAKSHPETSAFLLQQLSMMCTAQNATTLANNVLGLSSDNGWIWTAQQQQQLMTEFGNPFFWSWYQRWNLLAQAGSVVKNNNASGEEDNASGEEDNAIAAEEAIRHADIFFRWLDNQCSQPTVSRTQILQFKALLKDIKTNTPEPSNIRRERDPE